MAKGLKKERYEVDYYATDSLKTSSTTEEKKGSRHALERAYGGADAMCMTPGVTIRTVGGW